jgi:hypothetical protein
MTSDKRVVQCCGYIAAQGFPLRMEVPRMRHCARPVAIGGDDD